MRGLIVVALMGAATGLAGCAQSRLHLTQDYGSAVRQNIVAQVDDPDAKYVGLPESGSHGRRVAGAQERYVTGKVIPPESTKTQSVVSSGQ